MKQLLLKSRWTIEEKIQILEWIHNKLQHRVSGCEYICHIISKKIMNRTHALNEEILQRIFIRLEFTPTRLKKYDSKLDWTFTPTYISALTSTYSSFGQRYINYKKNLITQHIEYLKTKTVNK